MRSLKTREAAALLNISPNTLRTWERKYGYPKPLRSPGKHRAYTYAEIAALRDALARGLSVQSAISAVREELGADTEALVIALDAFSTAEADRAMEASLALRSLERSVDEVLLPALDEIRRRDGHVSARWAASLRWGVDWLGRAQRLSRPLDPGPGVLIGDASGGGLAAARASVHALELFCRRDGLRVLVLPVEAHGRLGEALAAVEPLCVVVVGGQASDEQVARWTYSVRRSAAEPAIAQYLRPDRGGGSGATDHVLTGPPVAAHRQLRDLVAASRDAKRVASPAEAHGSAQPG
ncbi:MAG TPA: MerR family DNA-binding transcriptional regulator [Solirubrobacterales bacterium]|nr:MerR family DNA-binding transcriptional regulator [Solirubrobacterales bacterium]